MGIGLSLWGFWYLFVDQSAPAYVDRGRVYEHDRSAEFIVDTFAFLVLVFGFFLGLAGVLDVRGRSNRAVTVIAVAGAMLAVGFGFMSLRYL